MARRSDYNSHVPATPPDRQVEAAQFVETLRFRRRDRRNWRRGRGNQLVRIWHELDGNSRAQNSDAPRNRAPRRSRTNHRLDSDSDRFLAPDSHWCLKVWFDDAPLAPTRHTRQARKASPQPYVSPESASPYSDADFAWHGCYGRARTRVNEFNGLWLLKNSLGGNPQKNDRLSLATGGHVVCCCDRNVIVPRSERDQSGQNESKRDSGKRLKNQVE